MSLQSLIENGQIEEIPKSVRSVEEKLKKAYSFFNLAKKIIPDANENEPIYTLIYDASRIGCEAILAFYGYRAKSSGEGRHRNVIEATKDLFTVDLNNEFKRMQNMRKKRNKLEYGNLTSISDSELKQAKDDVQKLLKAIEKLIHDNK